MSRLTKNSNKLYQDSAATSGPTATGEDLWVYVKKGCDFYLKKRDEGGNWVDDEALQAELKPEVIADLGECGKGEVVGINK
jgi:hypothetical protein